MWSCLAVRSGDTRTGNLASEFGIWMLQLYNKIFQESVAKNLFCPGIYCVVRLGTDN